MSTHFFTNQSGNNLFTKISRIFENNQSFNHFDVLVGYLRASGYFKLRPFLEKVDTVRILVGINVDQLTKKYQHMGQLYIRSEKETKNYLLDEIYRDIQTSKYDEETEKSIIQFIDDIIHNKIELRAHPTKTIHAKMYIVYTENLNEHTPCEVITGSSNLTDAGLGSRADSNYEFNVSLRNYDDVLYAKNEFEALWEQSVPVLEADAEKLKKNTYIRDDFTPFQIYIKMLIEYFGNRVDYDPYNIDLLLPDKYMKLKYQSDAANHGFAIMMKHNGVFLSDVVGLGKTIIACMIIKKYIYDNGPHTRVLIVLPPALTENWEATISDFKISEHITYITTGSLDKIISKNNNYINPDEIDMVVVDESHGFRNDNSQRYQQLHAICSAKRKILSYDGKDRKKILLLSATPLNNKPEDIENQLYLFQDRRNSTLESVSNIEEYFKRINVEYKEIVRQKELNIQRLKNIFYRLRNDIIETLVIRRTRTDIVQTEEYMKDLEKQGVVFPQVKDPEALYYMLDEKLATLFYTSVSLISGKDEDGNLIDGIGYYRYRAIEFLAADKQKEFTNPEQISSSLAGIMRIFLIKRLESSFDAFKKSLRRNLAAVENMIQMYENDRIFIAPDFDVNTLMNEGKTADQIESILLRKSQGNDKQFKEYAQKDFTEDYIEKLKEDKKKLNDLVKQWDTVSQDPKLDTFIENIKTLFFDTRNREKKLVIFTESEETCHYVKEHIDRETQYTTLMISSDNRQQYEQTIKNEFDANSDEQTDNYNIIITTEVLAEGINLHRSNIIINYDIPWNATRLMQRIGRVNRIGTQSDTIYIYNYYPSSHGNEQLNLINHALRRLQAFHTAFGEDSRIFSMEEEPGEGGLYGNKVKHEESLVLKYLRFLRQFRKENEAEYTRIQNMPNKIRCCRNISEELHHKRVSMNLYNPSGTTITYLKSDNHPGQFILTDINGNPRELSFIDAVSYFEAQQQEKAVEIHTKHFDQVTEAWNHFIESNVSKNVSAVKKKHLGPEDKKAINNLSFLKRPDVDRELQEKCSIVENYIKQGVYTSKNLSKPVNVYFQNNAQLLQESPGIFARTLVADLLNDFIKQSDTDSNNTYSIDNPEIILSESFT